MLESIKNVSCTHENVTVVSSDDDKPKNPVKKKNEPVPVGQPTEIKEDPMTGLVIEHPEEDGNDEVEVESADNSMDNVLEFSDNNSTANDSYTNLMAKENELTMKGDLSNREASKLEDVSSLVDALDDIEAAGTAHIEQLQAHLPESGLITGSAYAGYQSGLGEQTAVFEMSVKNSWQNKNKTFGIVAEGAFGYQTSKLSGEEFDFVEDDDENEIQQDDIPPTSTTETVKTGKIAANMRFDTKNVIYGGGFLSNFYPDKRQGHDVYASALHKSTGIGADLMRRMIVSVNDDGERILKSNMYFKVDLLSRDADSDDFGTDAIESEDAHEASPDTEESEHEVEEGAEHVKKARHKDGSGLDVDFEYDDSKCGFVAQYGINVINDKQKKAKLTLAPVLGIYDYTSPTDDDAEALKGTLGAIAEFKKQWADGQRVDATVYAANSRVIQQGSHPKDTRFVSFQGTYNNPRKNLNASVKAGIIDSGDLNLKFAEAVATYSTRNFNWGLQGGVTKLNYAGEQDYDYQVALKCTYTIPYRTKR